MPLVVDIETDSLQANKIWVVVTRDTKTNEIRSFREPVGFTNYIRDYDTFIGHNVLSFDVPVLNRLWGTHIKLSQIVDTMILSQLFNPNRKGGHSLDNLAQLAGYKKINFSVDPKKKKTILGFSMSFNKGGKIKTYAKGGGVRKPKMTRDY